MASVNDSLRTTMSRVKGSSHSNAQKFAFFTGGQKALLINPSGKTMQDAKQETGSGTSITGTCFFEDGKYVFETASNPPGSLAAGIKAILGKGGVSGDVVARKTGSGESESDESESEEPRKAKISAKVKALQAKLAALSKSAPQKVIPLRIKITQAGDAFKGAHLDEAEQRLEEAEELLK